MRLHVTSLVALMAWAGAGCGRRGNQQPAPAATSPALQAARLDTRRPLPLLPTMAHEQKQHMSRHLEAVQQIVAALAAGDFAAVEVASRQIGSSPQRQAMCERLAAGSPDFKSQAMNFHRTADTIGQAAHRRDPAGVLTALSQTLTTCTACHAVFRQEVVDESEWKTLMASKSPGPGRGEEARER
jgi:cytochrome c556